MNGTVLLAAVVMLALAGASLVAFQRTATTTGHIVTGAAAMITGVYGLVLLAALVF